jgi:two-component system cell cycle sensor histidine kinase/response regulator CckA
MLTNGNDRGQDLKPVRRLLLVVEDSPGDARLLQEMISEQEPLSTSITHVASMSEAEVHLARTAVDVIILDLGLPDAHGMDGVRRAQAAAPHVPLVVLTGLNDDLMAAQALQEGAQDYLVKGQIEGYGLVRAIRYAIERKVTDDARKASENQLLQAQKLESLGRLAGVIAHDFNNILSVILSYTAFLGEDLRSANQGRMASTNLLKHVDGIQEAAERATALTAQLLAFGRREVIALEVLDLNAAITRIVPMVRQILGKDTQLTVKLDPGAGHIRADDGQLGQIVVNLVVNARDAMPNGGTLTIETGNVSLEFNPARRPDVEAGPYVFLAVADSGEGMDHATRDHIFEPFFTTKNVGKGTGLGLATADGIMHRAGGHIVVASELGHGSTFTLNFPYVGVPGVGRVAEVGPLEARG